MKYINLFFFGNYGVHKGFLAFFFFMLFLQLYQFTEYDVFYYLIWPPAIFIIIAITLTIVYTFIINPIQSLRAYFKKPR